MPTISVIVPAYNAESSILETIESVQRQTFSDFELIVINDGSTDQLLEVLKSIKDERLKVFSYENSGVCVSRNRGISHATGEFITFLDADDLWTPDKLELQLAALHQHPKAGVAYSWTEYIDEQGKTLSVDKPVFFEGNVYTQLLVNNFLASGSNPLIRRQAVESIGGFDPAIPPCADWEFYLRLAANWPFVVVPKHQILYRQASGTMSAKIELMEEKLLIMVKKVFQHAPSDFQFLKGQSLARVYQYCAEKYLQNSTNNYKNYTVRAVDTMKEKIIERLEYTCSTQTEELNSFKEQILSSIFQTCAEKYLLCTRVDGNHAVNKAGYYLWNSISLYPKILLRKYTQDLMKWCLKEWFLLRFTPKCS